MVAAGPESSAGIVPVSADSDLDAAIAEALTTSAHVAVAASDVDPDPDLLVAAGRVLDGDRGVASVSVLDEAGVTALEATGTPGRHPRMTSRALRAALSRAALSPMSVPGPSAPLVVLSRHALSRVRELPPGEDPWARIAAWGEAAAARAFTHLVELSTVVERRLDDAGARGGPVPAFAPEDPAVAHAGRQVRIALRGLRVHIDGRTLEGAETGTEVHTLQLIRSLAKRPEVSYLGVNLRGSAPAYAREILADPRINAIEGCGEWSPDLPEVDVFHRPYQPLSREDCDLWRGVGARTACHMQDLITYLSPEYHPTVADWHRWRRDVARAVASVDGVFTLSHYVRDQLLREGLRGEPDLVWPAPCGVDHMVPTADAACPSELAGSTRPFALVLGSTYGHKNVDLATAAVEDARGAGTDLRLVTAGRQVEASSGGVQPAGSDAVHLGRNVSSAERNWLLANAAVVVFATSAEGFGLVPFEAAAYGTPTVCVSFGALEEHLGALPVTTSDWSIAAFSASIREIVCDRDAAAAQVAAIRRAARELTWDRTASVVLRGYREILRRPARG